VPNLIISPVGTSVLTQRPSEDSVLSLLRQTANKQEHELSADEKAELEAHVRSIRARMSEADRQTWKLHSAEVNGILSYGQPHPSDMHVLLATDTWQGRSAATIIGGFVKDALGCPVDTLSPKRLSARSREDFHAGMVEFVKWCGDTLPGYRSSGYKVVFNLTGGFKSVQGYLNTLGMLYADEIIYIFEPPSGELIVIPRLPMKLDEEGLIGRHAVEFEMMNRAGPLPMRAVDTGDVPESLIETTSIDGTDYAGLSIWGTAVWQRLRKDALGGNLLDWPRLQYADSFRKDYDRLGDTNVKVAVQEALASASSVLLQEGVNGLRAHRGLQYEDYQWHPGTAHFRVDDGRRISCELSADGLLLRHVGVHDYVNDSP